MARADTPARVLCLRWKVNSGLASMLEYQSRRPGVPVMYNRRFKLWNHISLRWPGPVWLPYSMGKAFSRPLHKSLPHCSHILIAIVTFFRK